MENGIENGIVATVRRRARRTVIAPGGALLGLVLLQGVCGALSMGVSPMKLHLSIAPGASESVAVEVYNTSDEPIRIVTSLTDWTISPDGELEFLEPRSSRRSGSPWVRPDLTDFTLSAGGVQTVRITAGLPDSARGSYWTIVLFEGQGEIKRDQIGLGAKARMGVTIYMTAAGTERQSFELIGMDVRPADGPGTLELAAAVANRGNVHHYPLGWFQVFDASGQMLFEETTPLRVSLPGQPTVYRMHWQPPAAGSQQLVVTFDCGLETLIQGIKEFEVSADAVIAGEASGPPATGASD